MKTIKALTLGALAIAAVAGGVWVYTDYQAWYALGPAGVPYNFQGWMQVAYWRVVDAKDPFDQSIFTPLVGKPGDIQALGDVPERMGPRPIVDPHPLPHRQITQRSSQETRKELRAMFDRVVERDAAIVAWGPSHVENGNDGVLLRQPEPGNPSIVHTRVWGEVAHIHLVDGSVHLVLSPSDAKKVMDAKWGELHRMAGIRGPRTYVLVYAPRNAEEIAIVEQMLEAAIKYSAYTQAAQS